MVDRADNGSRPEAARPTMTDGPGREAQLRAVLGPAVFDRYFCWAVDAPPASPGGLARVDEVDGRLRVRVPTRFAHSLIQRRFGAALEDAAGACGLASATIELDTRLQAGRAAGDDPQHGGRTREGPARGGPARGGPAAQAGSAESAGSTRGAFAMGDRNDAPGRGAEPGHARRDGNGTPSNGRAHRHAPGLHTPQARAHSNTRGTTPAAARLDDFITGRSNRQAYEAAVRMGDAERHPGFATLVVYGPCGVGKTHLLRGVATRFAETGGDPRRIRCTTAEQFTNEYIDAVKSGAVGQFQKNYRRVSLLCIDDIHFLATRGGTQKELLHTFDALDLCGARVVLVSDEHPRDIELLCAPLVSRFMGGAVARIDAPDDDLAERLTEHLANRGTPGGPTGAGGLGALRLGAGAARAIVDWTKRSVRNGVGRDRGALSARDLVGAVARVRATAEVSPGLLSPDGTVGAVLVDAALAPAGAAGPGGTTPSGPIKLAAIVEASAEVIGVSVGEVLGRGRHKRVVLARSVAAYLCREMTSHSTPEIATKLGRPNHSTVVTASQRVRASIVAGERVAVGSVHDGTLVSELVASVERRVRMG